MNFEKFCEAILKLGPLRCWCCPGDISVRNSACISWRVLEMKKHHCDDRHRNSMAGRYPVTEMFPCELCGKIPFHLHTYEEIDNWRKQIAANRLQEKA